MEAIKKTLFKKIRPGLSLAECSRTNLAQKSGCKQHVHRGRKNVARVETEPREEGKS